MVGEYPLQHHPHILSTSRQPTTTRCQILLNLSATAKKRRQKHWPGVCRLDLWPVVPAQFKEGCVPPILPSRTTTVNRVPQSGGVGVPEASVRGYPFTPLSPVALGMHTGGTSRVYRDQDTRSWLEPPTDPRLALRVNCLTCLVIVKPPLVEVETMSPCGDLACRPSCYLPL